MEDENITEAEEFVIDTSETSKEIAIQKLKEFSYYFTENVENNLNFCLRVIEERTLPKKSNSDAVAAVSLLAGPIPYVGKGLSSALKESESFILKKIDKKNSRTLADLVFYFSDNKESIRQALIESSTDLFYSFENQFLKLSCDGGSRRAMQKLANDAVNRIFTFFLETKPSKIGKNDFTKGVIYGGSLRNKIGMKTGRTVQNGEKNWKTSDIYEKVGLFNEDTGEFFKNKNSKCEVFGYRRIFDWENPNEIREKWSTDEESPSMKPHYHLEKEMLVNLYPAVKDYIMIKNVEEEAKLDREKKHEETLTDHQEKHEELIKTFMEKFSAIFEDLTRNYSEILVTHQQNTKIIVQIQENETVEAGRHQEITEKLTQIHQDVLETKDGQIYVQQTTELIKGEVAVIKINQAEISNVVVEAKKAVQDISLNDLVSDNYEVKKVTKRFNEVKESIENSNLERRVRKEVQRNLKKIRRVFK